MPPKSILGDLITALQDSNVKDAIASIFDTRVTELLETIKEVKLENEILRADLNAVKQRIDRLETYSKKRNLIIAGMPTTGYSDAVSQPAQEDDIATSTPSVESAVVKLFNTQLKVPISTADISVAHRLRPKKDDKTAPIIVSFTSLKARDAVYRARRGLKDYKDHRIYINEDLTRTVVELFRQARELVKEGKLIGAWTAGGVLVVRKSLESNCRPVKVFTATQLHEVSGS
jgi:hypothetical protein